MVANKKGFNFRDKIKYIRVAKEVFKVGRNLWSVYNGKRYIAVKRSGNGFHCECKSRKCTHIKRVKDWIKDKVKDN